MYEPGHAVAQRLDTGFPPGRPGFAYGQHVGFVVDKAALGHPSTSVSPANHSTDFSIIIITRGWHNRPLSGCSVEWTLIPPPTMQIKKKVCMNLNVATLAACQTSLLGTLANNNLPTKPSVGQVQKK
jgi:hypothetical protein